MDKITNSIDMARFRDPTVYLKMIEFVVSCLAVSIEQGGQAYFGTTAREFFGGGTLVMAIVVSGLLFACYVVGQTETQHTFFELAFNGLMTVMMLTAGALMISSYAGGSGTAATHGRIAGSLCILNTITYAVDTYFAWSTYSKARMEDQADQERSGTA